MNTLINFDFQMLVRIHQRSHARLNRKNSEKRKQTVSVNSQNLRKGELKIDLLTEVLYELVKMFFVRIQLTGGPDKHSMSQSESILVPRALVSFGHVVSETKGSGSSHNRMS